MAAPSLTYTLTNGQTADASQVQQNFSDLLNGITDGTKDLSISALTCAGTATLNGHVNLGNSSADDLIVTASLAGDLVPKTPSGTYNLGSASLGFLSLYLAASGDGDTARLVAAAHAADRTYTIPDAGANATIRHSENYVSLTDLSFASTPAGWSMTYAKGMAWQDPGGNWIAYVIIQGAATAWTSITFTINNVSVAAKSAFSLDPNSGAGLGAAHINTSASVRAVKSVSGVELTMSGFFVCSAKPTFG